MTPDMNETLRIAKQVASARFLGTTVGLVGVGAGTKIIEGVDTQTPAVKFYVSNKPEENQIAPANLLPEKILGIQTDVVPIGRPFGPRINARRIRPNSKGPAKPGDSIGPRVDGPLNFNPVFSGTFGAVLCDSGDRMRRFLLSNNHILAVNGRVPLGSEIVTPGAEDALGVTQKAIAKFKAAVRLEYSGQNYVDCALAEIYNNAEVTSVSPDNVPVSMVRDANIGLSVFKFGKSTAKTYGRVVDVQADILVDYSFGTFAFKDQVLIDGGASDFAADGDSGALVMASEPGATPSNSAVGLVFAPAGRYTAASPISKVLESLQQFKDILQLKGDLAFASDIIESQPKPPILSSQVA
jgi:hypothetical protein